MDFKDYKNEEDRVGKSDDKDFLWFVALATLIVLMLMAMVSLIYYVETYGVYYIQ